MPQAQSETAQAGDLLLERVLRRSEELEEAAWEILSPEGFEPCDDSARVAACCRACEVAIEHGSSLRLLISVGNQATAAAVLRLQFEAAIRAIWLLYAATDDEVEKIQAAPSEQADKAATKLAMVSGMIKALDGKGPPMAHAMASHFKDVMASSLNSYVHTGNHALQRSAKGFSPAMLAQLARQSNGLFAMTAMLLANVTGDDAVIVPMRAIQRQFADCLPELLAEAPSRPSPSA